MRIDKIFPGGIFPRVKRAFEKAKVTNVAFEALDQFERTKMEME